MVLPKGKNTCFILMRLTALSLPVLLIASIYHSKTMFIICGERMARFFGPVLLRLGIEQLSEHEYYQDATYHNGHKNAVATGKRLAESHKDLVNVFPTQGRNLGHAELVTFCFVETWANFAYLQPIIQKFIHQNADEFLHIRFWGAEAVLEELWPGPSPKNVSFIRGIPFVYPVLNLVRKLGRVTYAIILPIINISVILRKGIKPSIGRRVPAKSGTRILFLHRHSVLDPGRNHFRDMYMLRSGILDYGQCVHAPMSTSQNFFRDKRSFLETRGGTILEPKDLYISIADIFIALFPDHIRFLISALPNILFRDGINRKFLTKYLEYCHLLLISRAYLDASGADIVVAETEHQSVTRSMGMATREKSVRMVTMIHGSGAQSRVTLARSFSWADYYIVEGNDYDCLLSNSPSIRHFYPAGCIELSACNSPALDILPTHVLLNRESYKIVSFFLNIGTNFVNMHSMWSESHYIDSAKVKKLIDAQLMPLFDWIAADERIILIWSTKPRDMNENPLLKSLVTRIPRARLVINHDLNMTDIMGLSDLCVASSGSTVATVSMLKKIPTVTHDMFYGGIDDKWSPRMVGKNGEELAQNAKYVLDHGLPDSAYEAAKWAHHGNAPLELEPKTRISALFKTLLVSDDLYPEPPKFCPE